MPCPDPTIISGCDFVQALVDQLPHFDEVVMRDITPTDGWILNVSTETEPIGTPVETTQDRFRGVWPNTTKTWTRVVANGPGCVGSPCDPTPHEIGWGADRRTYYTEEQVWESPLVCYNQMMHITHAKEHLQQIVSDVFRPATLAISSGFLRKRHLQWAGKKWAANANMDDFTFAWSLGGANLDEEIFFDCSVAPDNVFLLVPQMLQNRFSPLMREGYAGKNPFKETAPFIELVTSMDTCWQLDKYGAQLAVPGVPGSNWRFQDFSAANKYWRYGFSGQLGNYMVRVDELGLRFNFEADLGEFAGPNRYRYRVILPYFNTVTTGAGGSPGIGRVVNTDYDKAQFQISHIHHKMGMALRVSEGGQLHPDMPFGHTSFGGQWKWLNNDLGEDDNGRTITNKWGNKGQFGAWFKYKIRPKHTEFMEGIFHKREQHCVPEIDTCSPSPGYPTQNYSSGMTSCYPDEHGGLN
jgi:hypothetical protein